MGVYISLEEHKPLGKRSISKEEYQDKMASIGPEALNMFLLLQEKLPTYWHSMTRGILHLKTKYSDDIINMACKRAIRFRAISYQHVKRICENGLYHQEEDNHPVINYTQEYGHDLKAYDQI
jgi:hypothetical protein